MLIVDLLCFWSKPFRKQRNRKIAHQSRVFTPNSIANDNANPVFRIAFMRLSSDMLNMHSNAGAHAHTCKYTLNTLYCTVLVHGIKKIDKCHTAKNEKNQTASLGIGKGNRQQNFSIRSFLISFSAASHTINLNGWPMK